MKTMRKSTQGRKSTQSVKKGGLTSELLERRVKQLLANEVVSQKPEKPLTLAKGAGTLEQIGHEADQAWSGVKKIMALLNTEMKHVYFNANNNVTQAGSVVDLTSLISQGVGGTQRIGDSLKIKRVRIKCLFNFNGAATVPCAATFVLGHSRDGVPAVADVFAVVSSLNAGHAFPSDTYDKVDHWSKSRFVRLDTYRPTQVFELNCAYNHDVLYANASTTATSGCVWFAFIANEPTNFSAVYYGLDLEFLDN